ncbi:hypothetical protein L1987_09249 [Smallanthus sonchifolius]|uniref:Uncharacterized protein n=1 Tax=Smallanthus sonchifolius TaxID=185202 RepID=A0ACB9JPA0_9ASTR|nr:hypothetical protein L1987_09249 [Smallanthus sonchifolius]
MGELVGNSMIFELVNRLIDLDVDIGWDEILLDDPNSKGIFEMELEDMARPVDETEMDMDEPHKEYSGRKVLWGNVVAQKLDTLMDLTFDHLQSCFKSGRLLQVFEALLRSFQSTVLNAYKSKFAQFVMFYACSLDPEDCGTQFVSRLLEIFRSTVYPQDRMSAIAYLASYMSRAKFLSTSYVTIILERHKNNLENVAKIPEAQEIQSKIRSIFKETLKIKIEDLDKPAKVHKAAESNPIDTIFTSVAAESSSVAAEDIIKEKAKGKRLVMEEEEEAEKAIPTTTSEDPHRIIPVTNMPLGLAD